MALVIVIVGLTAFILLAEWDWLWERKVDKEDRG
jgi:hypothetical protein